VTRAEQRALRDYVRWVADAMGLRDWLLDVVVAEEVPEGGLPHSEEFRGVAAATPVPGQRRAGVHFTHGFRTDHSAQSQRAIVVHELVHCHLADMREFVRSCACDLLAQQTYDVLSFGFDLAWEHATDAIACAWAEKMPLIAWPKEAR